MRRSPVPTQPPAAEPGPSPVIERPDGFYWRDPFSGNEFGPFDTLAEAQADMESDPASGKGIEPGETLREAEEELGIADWIDPETGEPAEESVPHIEEH